MPADQPQLRPPSPRAQAALDFLGGLTWPQCTDPPTDSCTDDACPVHGREAAHWVTCPACSVLVPGGMACGQCGRPL
jgi:hypothetical protein